MSILLFGATGHLAQTRLIPRLYRAGYTDVSYVSRRPKQGNSWYTIGDTLPSCDVTYFAVNSEHLPEVADAIPKNTRLCLENPIGTDYTSARALMDTVDSYNFDSVLYVDHYLFKYVPTLSEHNIHVSDITKIYVTIHKTADVEDRMASFSETGVVRDFIQNHVLMTISEMLSRELNATRLGVLNATAPFSTSARYDGCPGPANCPTQVSCKTEINISEQGPPVDLYVDVVKRASSNTYSIDVCTRDGSRHSFTIQPDSVYNMYSSNILTSCQMIDAGDAYTSVLSNALNRDAGAFPSRREILRCWEIVAALL